MPVYDYACQSCGRQIEVVHGVHDSDPRACTECGGPMRKLLSRPAIVFKGSGWAKNDARSSRPAATSSSSSDTTDAGADKPAADKSPADNSTAKESTSSAGSSDD
ncbi:zinc ribbon domain-containing protein [soil metagenome]